MNRINTEQDYWLTIEPYVYIHLANSSVLLYNTLDAAYVESENPAVVQLVQRLLEKQNCGVCLLTKEELTSIDIVNFVVEIRQKFIGDIIPVKFSDQKPIQLIPFLNFQQDKNRLSHQPNMSIGENIMTLLHEVNFIFKKGKELGVQQINSILEEVRIVPSINLHGDIWDYSYLPQLLQSLNKVEGNKTVIVPYQKIDVDKISSINLDNSYTFDVHVNFPINEFAWNSLMGKFTSLNKWAINVFFEVEQDEHLVEAEKLINQHRIENYQLLPVYNSHNITFFEKNVFLTKEDLFSTPMSLKEIYAHQTLNTYNFGKLYVNPDGTVCAERNGKIIGSIGENTIKEVLCKEISNGSSWLRIRDKQPCTECLYQWLCPSPSSYEKVVGRSNLCHI